MRTNSKAQIAIFVAISTLLVIGMILFFTLNSEDKIKVFTSDKSSYKIKEFIEDCMLVESRTAVEQIGLHGGWLYHPNMIFADMNTNELLVKRAEGVDFFGIEIPYWYYYDDSDDTFRIRYPDYDTDDEFSLKNQIKRYIDENLDKRCLLGFSTFEDIYDVEYEPRKIQTTVEMDDDDIIVSLYLPVKIKEKNTKDFEYVDQYKAKIENKLKVPYHLAVDIVNAEDKHSFAEKQTLSIINAYQTSDGREGLPPFYDFRTEFDLEPWKIDDVELMVKNIISSNVGLIQFRNTNYQEYPLPDSVRNSPFAQGVISSFNRDYLSNSSLFKRDDPKLFRRFSDYQVVPEYLPFLPMQFSIRNSMGDIVLFPKAEYVFMLLPFATTEYVSVYQMTYPLIFEISSGELNDDFVFNLMMEVNIDHNTALKENVDYFGEGVDFTGSSQSTKSLVCDPTQFISKHISLNISDPVNYGKRKDIRDREAGIDEAVVNFDCKGISTCFIGETQAKETDSKTLLRFKVPINCNPGTLEIYKYGHKKLTIENLDPNLDEEINLGHMYMPSKKEVKLRVNMIDSSSGGFSSGRALEQGEIGFIILQNLEDEQIVEVVELDSENQYNKTVELMPGNYSIEGYVMYEGNIHIPEDEVCFKSGLFDEDCETIPAVDLESWVTGAVKIDNFNVDLEWLLVSDKFVVNLIDLGKPSNYDDLQSGADILGEIDLSSRGKEPYFD